MPNVFATEIQKPITQQKICIAEIDIGKLNVVWIPIYAGVWIVSFINAYSCEDTFTDIPDTVNITNAGSVSVNGVQMAKVLSPAACIIQDSSFYYESGTHVLYLHCPNGDSPFLFKVSVGSIYGFRKGGITACYGGVNYEDRLLESPNISLNKDPTFFGVLTLDSCTFKIANADGELDFLTRNENIFGNKGRVRIGFDGWALTEFQQVFEGTIGKITTDEEFITVEVKDFRGALSKSIPENVFSTSVYPLLNADDIGKPIPRVFGTVRNAPCYVIDQDMGGVNTTATYHVKISDTEYTSAINALAAAYVNGNQVVPGGVNLGTRTFTLAHTTSALTNQYTAGDEVTVDLIGEVTSTGGVIDNGAHVIRKLLYDYYGFTYANDFFDLSKWDELKAKDIGLWIGEDQKPIIDIIGMICSDGIQGDFFVGGDGRYKLRIWDSNRASIQTIKRNAILKTPTISDDPTKTITSALIGYSKDWKNNEYRLFLDDANESDIFEKYPVYNQKKFDTLMVGSTDASDYSDIIFDKSSDIETIIQVTIPGWLCVEREIGDVVIIHCNRKTSDWYKRIKAEIIGVDKNLNDHTTGLTLRMVQRLDDIPYTKSWMYTDNTPDGYVNYYCTDTQEQHIYYGMTINES